MVERNYLVYNSFSSYYAGVQEYFNQGWVMEHLEVLQNENSLYEQFVVVMKKEIKQETEQKMENEVSTRNKTSQEIIKELKTNIATLRRLGCSGAFFDGYYSAAKDVCRMLEGE